MWCVLRQCGRLTEKEARFVIACVVEAIAYLHRHHIIYRSVHVPVVGIPLTEQKCLLFDTRISCHIHMLRIISDSYLQL